MTAVQILLVVDEEDRALELRQQVESLGYRVIGLARSGEEALAGVSELRPDLIIWDIGMPRDPRSLPFVEEVRACLVADLPVLVLVPEFDAELIQHCRPEAGFNCLRKPAGLRDLCIAIETTLCRYREDRQGLDSERKFRTIFESALDAMFLLDGPMIVDCNPTASRLFGVSREALIGQNFLLFSPPVQPDGEDSLKKARAKTEAALQGQPQFFEWQHQRADGTRFYVEASLNLLDIDDHPLLLTSIHDITRRKQIQADLQRQNLELELLNRVSHALISTLNLDKVFPAIMEEVRFLLDVDSASVWLIDQERGGVLCHQAVGFRSEFVNGWHLEAGQGLADWVARRGESLLVLDTREEKRYFRGVEQKTGVEMRSVLTVPLIVNHKVIGVLQATDTEPNRFDPKDQRLLESMATPSAIAIDNARLYQQTQQDAITRAALLDEVNHRVKNNLTAILGILYAEQRHAQDHPERPYEQMLDDLINRVQGLTTVHAMLSDSEWSPLLLSDLVERVIQAVVKAMPPERRIATTVAPSAIRVSSKQASSLALIINELATNTVKYVLKDYQNAHIKVTITPLSDRQICLEFRDDGPGYPEEVLTLGQTDVGLYLVKRLVQMDLHGNVAFSNDAGAVTSICFGGSAEAV